VTIPAPDFVIAPLATSAFESLDSLRRSLDEIPDNAAVLDAQGVIVMVNLAWRQYALAYSQLPGQMPPNSDVGVNYLEISSRDHSAPDSAAQAVNGIRAVLSGKADTFTLRYPCHSPKQQFWFTMMVTPLTWSGQRGVLVIHRDSTPQHRLQSR
jgi:hypothetical protein